MEVGTLKELNVQQGDVVECVGRGSKFLFTIGDKYYVGGTFDYPRCNGVDSGIRSGECDWTFRQIVRANPKPKTWGEMTDA